MEQVSKLLFALTLLSVFAYLLIYTSMSSAGNGGEYWGFDGHIEPHFAASDSFAAGNYELLALEISSPLGGRIEVVPRPILCTSISGQISTSIRVNKLDAIHGSDSVRLAKDFLQNYNRSMSSQVRSKFGYACTGRH